MPKLIEDVRTQLLQEARRQVAERGYAKTTIRSVAGECRIAVGTVYNYFPSKEYLIASFVAEDWNRSLDTLRSNCPRDAEGCLRQTYQLLRSFAQAHHSLFSDSDAAKAFSGAFPMRHLQLREQLAELIRPTLTKSENSDEFQAQFLAEALLTWTIAGVPFEQLYSVLQRLILPLA